MRALGQNPTESDVKKLVVDSSSHPNQQTRPDDRVTFEVFLPMLQVNRTISMGENPCIFREISFQEGKFADRNVLDYILQG